MQGHDRQSFEPVTMGHIRSHGCRDLLVYCESGWCNHSAMEILPFRNGRFEWTAVRARADCQYHMTRIISYLSANVSPCQRLAPRASPVSPNPAIKKERVHTMAKKADDTDTELTALALLILGVDIANMSGTVERIKVQVHALSRRHNLN
jgi:hypothetical protein